MPASRLIIIWLLCVPLVGCGGLTRELRYRPIVPVDSETKASYGRAGDFQEWRLPLDRSELILLPVEISEKLLWVFGPLIAFPVFFLEDEIPNEGALAIRVTVRVEPGDVIDLDPREFTVELENGRRLSPKRTLLRSQTGEHRSEPVRPVHLSGASWSRTLEYDVLVADLVPFALRLGPITVNGEASEPPPIRFVRDKRYRGS